MPSSPSHPSRPSRPRGGETTSPLDGARGRAVLRFRQLDEGALFAGRYRILARIGHGATGEIFRARDELADEEVALKVLFPGTGGITLPRLRRELRLVRRLRHPGILRIHDIGESEGLLYLVTELLEGESLKERLARRGRLPAPEVRRILAGLLEALAAAHAAGLVHRDVKPGNIFLVPRPGGGEQVVLLDFGLAREVAEATLTTVGRFVGTPAYSAPEQVRGDPGIGPAVSRTGPDGPLEAAALGGGMGPLRRLWVVDACPDLPAFRGRRGPGAIRSALPWFAPLRRALAPGVSLPWSWVPWRDVGGTYRRVRAWSLEGVRRGGEPLLALAATHSPSYPSWVVALTPRGDLLGPWFHPGHVVDLVPYRREGPDDLFLAVAAFGNQLGPRPVIHGLPASVRLRGQAPPWTAPLASLERAQGWTTFLPFRAQAHDVRLKVGTGGLEVQVPGLPVLHLDPSTGIPLEPAARAGLDRETWGAHRDRLLEVLYEAEGLARVGRPGEGALLLDRFAAGIDRPPEMVAVAAYRAAVEHLRSSATRGRAALAASLRSVERALAAEPSLPRARLLWEELLVRLGRLDGAARSLRDWGRGGEEAMYVYEHFLLDRLAGMPVPPERFLEPWNAGGDPPPWTRLVLQVIAHDRKDWAAADRLAAGISPDWRSGWNVHHWWAARALLDRPEPDPEAALRHLAPGALAGDAGMVLPVECARVLATVLATGASPPGRLDAAEAELAHLARRAAWDLHALVTLPWAREDLARARRLLEKGAVRGPAASPPARSPRP